MRAVSRKELQPLQEGLAEVRAAVATKASEDHAQESAAALQDLSRRLDEAMVRPRFPPTPANTRNEWVWDPTWLTRH